MISTTEICPQIGAQPIEPAGAPVPENAARRRILLVDDSEDIRALVAAYLEHTPHQLEMVADGQAAVEKFCSGHFDLVLMDVQMPVMDGHTAARAIRQWEAQRGTQRAIILSLTGGAAEADASSGGEPVCDAQLSKPFRMGTFLLAVEDHLKAHDATRVPSPSGIERLVPGYLASRKAEVHVLETALAGGDYRTIRFLGHNLRGSGNPYGFPAISYIGRSLESAAGRQSPDEIRLQIAALGDYLARLKVVG
jgi:CheY-like chemotaxis protein/HPt (histidine-containing phosphotransfer) domain-containing protein